MARRQSTRLWNVLFWLLSLIVVCAILGLLYTKRSMFSILHEGYTEEELPQDIAPFSHDNLDCYVINLKKNPDRMLQFQTNYNKTDLAKTNPIIRSEAIYGKEISFQDYISPKPDIPLHAGMVGCFLSHLDLLNTIANGTKPYGLIFEDDANVHPQIYDKTIRHLSTMVPSDWDMILLGYFDYDKTHRFIQLDTCKKALNFWGLHGYLVNRTSARKMQSIMQPPFSAQIDHVMSKLSREGQLNIYAINQPVVWQNAKYSDVQVAK